MTTILAALSPDRESGVMVSDSAVSDGQSKWPISRSTGKIVRLYGGNMLVGCSGHMRVPQLLRYADVGEASNNKARFDWDLTKEFNPQHNLAFLIKSWVPQFKSILAEEGLVTTDEHYGQQWPGEAVILMCHELFYVYGDFSVIVPEPNDVAAVGTGGLLALAAYSTALHFNGETQLRAELAIEIAARYDQRTCEPSFTEKIAW